VGKDSKIEWTHHTFNPWIGCTKVSDGCKNCYAEALMDKRWKKVKWGPGAIRQRTSRANWWEPIKWDNAAKKAGVRRRVFCASLADVFDEEVPDEWRRDLLMLTHQTRNLDWLFLTKRAQKMKAFMNCPPEYMHTIRNIWLGVSVENQKTADERIPLLLDTPAAVRFVSYEPALGPVDFTPYWRVISDPEKWLSWIIVGGESGHGARPFDIAWARSVIHQCQAFGVPCFVKQLGAVPLAAPSFPGHVEGPPMLLADRKGGDPAEWPEDLRVREFPIANHLDSV